jgi:hypothetical protein
VQYPTMTPPFCCSTEGSSKSPLYPTSCELEASIAGIASILIIPAYISRLNDMTVVHCYKEHAFGVQRKL